MTRNLELVMYVFVLTVVTLVAVGITYVAINGIR